MASPIRCVAWFATTTSGSTARATLHGATADELALDTRILTVCDVYDALISPRVYRAAWTHEDAMALLRSEVGTAYDERCVEALGRLLADEQPSPAAHANKALPTQSTIPVTAR